MSSNAYKLDYDYPRKPHIGDFFKVGSKTHQGKKPQVTELHIEYIYDSADNRTRAKYRARYFDTEMGRFISRDPLGYVDGYSLYTGYFGSKFGMDPSGLKSAFCCIQEKIVLDAAKAEVVRIQQELVRIADEIKVIENEIDKLFKDIDILAKAKSAAKADAAALRKKLGKLYTKFMGHCFTPNGPAGGAARKAGSVDCDSLFNEIVGTAAEHGVAKDLVASIHNQMVDKRSDILDKQRDRGVLLVEYRNLRKDFDPAVAAMKAARKAYKACRAA